MAQVFQGSRHFRCDEPYIRQESIWLAWLRSKNDGNDTGMPADFVFRNYASRLPEVYSGHPNRIERYNQYENMDMDSEINACLDIIAEFSTQMNEQNGTPFEVDYRDKPTDNEVQSSRNNCNSGSS
jgi:hypothetical protein